MSVKTTSYEVRQKFANTPLEKKQRENTSLFLKYPSKIPVIIFTKTKGVPEPEKCKFLIDRNVSVAEFLTVLRKYIKLSETDSIFLFTENNTIPASSQLMSELYEHHKNEDKFLYLEYTFENTFG
jgi:GABA(A) receptor-associated protein